MIPNILIADDNSEILESYRGILNPQKSSLGKLQFPGEDNSRDFTGEYSLLLASQGDEVVKLAVKQYEAGGSIQVAFLDFRMPPGINGMETALRLRKIDSVLPIVIVSAYQDFSFEEIIQQLSSGQNLLVLQKPFSSREIKQLTYHLCAQWEKRKEMRSLTQSLCEQCDVRIRQLLSQGEGKEIAVEILEYTCLITGGKSSALIQLDPDGEPQYFAGTGLLSSATDLNRFTSHGLQLESFPIFQSGELHRWRLILLEPEQSKSLLEQIAQLLQPLWGRIVGLSNREISFRSKNTKLVETKLRNFHGILTNHAGMRHLFKQIHKVAQSEVPVFIQGHTGSGKELLANAIHKCGPRKSKPFIPINCAHLTEQFLESQLFGHKKGAFTGATEDRKGLLAEADGGILFLDEVVEIPLTLQAKLLRVLQEKEYRPLGSNVTIKFDAQIISAAQLRLDQAVSAGNFRGDLQYRLQVIPLEIPPLKNRGNDALLLLIHFLREGYSTKYPDRQLPEISREVVDLVNSYNWPGNIRELRNLADYFMILQEGPVIEKEHLSPDFKASFEDYFQKEKRSQIHKVLSKSKSPSGSESDSERTRIMDALKLALGNRTKAAEGLGMSRMTLWRKMKYLGIQEKYFP